MILKMVPSFLVFMAVAIFNGASTKTSAKEKLNRVCEGASEFFEAYQQNCPAATRNGVETGATALCGIVQKRFESAEDLKDTPKARRLRANIVYSEQSDICIDSPRRTQSIIAHLQNAILYFGTPQNLQNNTAVVGIRTVEAQIGLAREWLRDNNIVINTELLSQLKTLESNAKKIALLIEDESYNNWNIADQITSAQFYWKSPRATEWKPWNIIGDKQVNPAPQFRNLTHYDKHHDVNNDCHVRMMKDCDLSQECANLLIDRSAEITTLVHDILFFQTAIRLECVEEVDFMAKFPNSNWKIVMEDHCGKMWDEANAISNAEFPTGYKGIFLAHSTMCALVGFPNFLRADWADDIMAWMDTTSTACIPPDTPDGTGDVDVAADSKNAKGEWCTTYETSMGMQLLALHLRYAIETCHQG